MITKINRCAELQLNINWTTKGKLNSCSIEYADKYARNMKTNITKAIKLDAVIIKHYHRNKMTMTKDAVIYQKWWHMSYNKGNIFNMTIFK